ncbi:F0F1 ATP synthase subunit A [Patescibacteria group bacterium]|nr:F0F1 ATP synthase subunit A [Patescibacteria group bacterium]
MTPVHIPLAAETIAHIGSFPLTNTLANALVLLGFFVTFGYFVRRSFSVRKPKRLQLFLEMFVEQMMGAFDQVTQDRAKTRKILPLIGALFLFVLLSNWLGLFPGVGSIGVWEMGEHGVRELIPIFRSANSDLNVTVALALVAVIGSHVLGVTSFGPWKHFNKFFQLTNLGKAAKSKQPIPIMTAIVELAVGVIEVFGEVAKVVSLSFRLFGNIFAGEVLLSMMYALVAYFVPLPFMGLELLVGLVQATVFSTLALVYVVIMTTPAHGDEPEGAHH